MGYLHAAGHDPPCHPEVLGVERNLCLPAVLPTELHALTPEEALGQSKPGRKGPGLRVREDVGGQRRERHRVSDLAG